MKQKYTVNLMFGIMQIPKIGIVLLMFKIIYQYIQRKEILSFINPLLAFGLRFYNYI